jgi:tetratricopeptide (TPR) repeat protein
MVGNIHRKNLEFARALPCFQRVLERDPHNPYAVFGMADSLRGLGRFGEAMPYWEEILAADPGNSQVLTRAGDCLYRLGRLPEAEDLFRRTLALGYDKPALMGLARLHRQRGETDAAAACCRKILAHNPADARVRKLLADILAEGSPA